MSVVAGADGSYEPQRALYYTQIFQSAQGTQMPGDSLDLIGATEKRNFVLRQRRRLRAGQRRSASRACRTCT